jgi:GNAT superfamily N-acetyltransferase
MNDFQPIEPEFCLTFILHLHQWIHEDLDEVRALFEEYRRHFGGDDLEHEGFAEEIAGLPWVYQAPYGDLLLAKVDGRPAGCVALRSRSADEGELKRMFVLPAFRGCGAGRALAAAALRRAWALGMSSVCLDTLPLMVGAQELYASLGFKSRVAYGGKSIEETLFFEVERPRTLQSIPA